MGGKRQKSAPLGYDEVGEGGEVSRILEERGKTHGDFVVQAWVTQNLKEAVESGPNWVTMSADKKESIHMICHKMARIVCGDPEFEDAWLDICGYSQLVLNNLRK